MKLKSKDISNNNFNETSSGTAMRKGHRAEFT